MQALRQTQSQSLVPSLEKTLQTPMAEDLAKWRKGEGWRTRCTQMITSRIQTGEPLAYSNSPLRS